MVVVLVPGGGMSVGTPAQQRGAILRQPIVTEERRKSSGSRRGRSNGRQSVAPTPTKPEIVDEDFVGPPSPSSDSGQSKAPVLLMSAGPPQKTIKDFIDEKRAKEARESLEPVGGPISRRRTVSGSEVSEVVQETKGGQFFTIGKTPQGGVGSFRKVPEKESFFDVGKGLFIDPVARTLRDIDESSRFSTIVRKPFELIEERTGEPVTDSLRKAANVSAAVAKIPLTVPINIKGGTTEIPVKVTTPFIPVPTQLQPTLKRGRDLSFELGLTAGTIEFLRDKPVTTVATAATLGFAFGAGIKALVSSGVKSAKPAAAIIGGTLGGAFALTEGSRLLSQPTKFDLGRASSITAIELASFGLGGKAGSKVVGLGTDVIKIRQPLRPVIKKGAFFEAQQIIKTPEGKLEILSDFIQRRELSPPIKVTTTTRLREFLGAKPLKPVKIIPAKVVEIFPEKPGIVSEKPSKLLERIVDNQRTREIIIEGRTEQIDLANIKKLSNRRGFNQVLEMKLRKIDRIKDKDIRIRKRLALIDRELSTKRASDFGTIKERSISDIDKSLIKKVLGKDEPITLQFLDKLLGKDTKLFLSDIKTFRIDAPLGKKTQTFRSVAKLKKVLETEQGDIIKIDSSFKDVSKPFARNVGELQELSGTVVRSKIVRDFSKEGKTKFLTPAEITKTPLSKTFGSELETLQKIKLKDVQALKSPPLIVKTAKTSRTIAINKLPRVLPLIRTGTKTVSPFAVTQGKLKLRSKQVQSQQLKSLNLTKLSTAQRIKTEQLPKAKTKTVQQQKFKQQLKQELKIEQQFKQPQLQKFKEALSFKVPLGRTPKIRRIIDPIKTMKLKIPSFPKPKVGGIKKKRKKKDEFDDAITFVEGFTAKALGLKPIKIKAEDAPKIKQTPIGIRRGIIIT